MTAVPEPSDALVEAIARAIDTAPTYPDRDLRGRAQLRRARAAWAAIVQHLELTEEKRYAEPVTQYPEPTPTERRLATPWRPGPMVVDL